MGSMHGRSAPRPACSRCRLAPITHLQLLFVEHADPLGLDQRLQAPAPAWTGGWDGFGGSCRAPRKPTPSAPCRRALLPSLPDRSEADGRPEEGGSGGTDLPVEPVVGHPVDVGQPVLGGHRRVGSPGSQLHLRARAGRVGQLEAYCAPWRTVNWPAGSPRALWPSPLCS